MMKYLSGENQVIMTGEIAGCAPFKIKVDSLHRGKALVDLKIMRDFQPVGIRTGTRRLPWWLAWGYDFQAAIYQEVERQIRGRTPRLCPSIWRRRPRSGNRISAFGRSSKANSTAHWKSSASWLRSTPPSNAVMAYRTDAEVVIGADARKSSPRSDFYQRRTLPDANKAA